MYACTIDYEKSKMVLNSKPIVFTDEFNHVLSEFAARKNSNPLSGAHFQQISALPSGFHQHILF